VKVDEDVPTVQVDSPSVKRLFYNLFLNAFQAMPNGGELTVDVHSAAGSVIVAVEDTGVGISQKKHA